MLLGHWYSGIQCSVLVSFWLLWLSPFHTQKLMLRLNHSAAHQAKGAFPKQCSRTELHDSSGIQKGPRVTLCINLVFLGLYKNKLVSRNYTIVLHYFVLFCFLKPDLTPFPQNTFFLLVIAFIRLLNPYILHTITGADWNFTTSFRVEKGRFTFCIIMMGSSVSVATTRAMVITPGDKTNILCYMAYLEEKKTYHLRKKIHN